jgi:hypothetical protein
MGIKYARAYSAPAVEIKDSVVLYGFVLLSVGKVGGAVEDVQLPVAFAVFGKEVVRLACDAESSVVNVEVAYTNARIAHMPE